MKFFTLILMGKAQEAFAMFSAPIIPLAAGFAATQFLDGGGGSPTGSGGIGLPELPGIPGIDDSGPAVSGFEGDVDNKISFGDINVGSSAAFGKFTVLKAVTIGVLAFFGLIALKILPSKTSKKGKK